MTLILTRAVKARAGSGENSRKRYRWVRSQEIWTSEQKLQVQVTTQLGTKNDPNDTQFDRMTRDIDITCRSAERWQRPERWVQPNCRWFWMLGWRACVFLVARGQGSVAALLTLLYPLLIEHLALSSCSIHTWGINDYKRPMKSLKKENNWMRSMFLANEMLSRRVDWERNGTGERVQTRHWLLKSR